MKIDYNKIKAGDRVQIANGDWFEIIGEGDPEPGACNVWAWFDVGEYQIPSYLITDHKPAHVPQPVDECEWVTADVMVECCDACIGPDGSGDENNAAWLNKWLTKKYGHPPIVRTYNGEPVSEWGLADDAWVLVFSDGRYIDMRYAHLRMGDQWLPMLPAPKPTTEE